MKTAEQILLERVSNVERHFVNQDTSAQYLGANQLCDSINWTIQQSIRTKVSLADEARDYAAMQKLTREFGVLEYLRSELYA